MATGLIPAVLHALYMAFAMGWEILWPLILGFAVSAVIQAVVSQREMSRLLPDDSPRSLGIALALGAASSSCSYAAVCDDLGLGDGSDRKLRQVDHCASSGCGFSGLTSDWASAA